jgi:DNA-binding transcriptional LysR family regulator
MTQRDLLESDALRSFAVFAEHRNFTTAAAALHLSQPSLHVKIRKLAAALGVELYERHGRRLVLTPTGERLAAFALDSARRLDDFLAELESGAATVTIAAGRGAVRWVIGDAVRRISAGGRKVRVMAAGREATLRALATGRADVAVVGYDLPPPSFDSVEIAAYPQVLVVGAGHPLAGRDRLALADLEGLELVLPAPDRPHRRTLERALLAASVSWRLAAEADGWDLLVHLAGLGIGATVVNGCVEVPAGLVAVPVTDLPAVRYWAAWRPQRLPLLGDVLQQLQGS